MKQLSGLDASFLYMETPSQFGHVSSLSIFEKPDDPNHDPFTAWRAQIEKRLHTLEPLRRRLRNVPMNLDHPFWIDDPDFDLDFHVRNTAVPPPGSDQQLADLVARIIGRPLDRTRPLWETYVVEGLPDDRFAILTKVHHATIDGASGAELLTMMLDQTPEGDDVPPPEEKWNPAPNPSDAEVLARAGANLARKPARAILLTTRVIREFGKSTRNPALVAAANQVRGGLRGPLGAVLNLGRDRTPEGETKGPLPSISAPRTPFNAPITAHRRFAFRSTSLDSVKGIKNALGATVNDVVMAVCAGGLRTWLEDHDALPDGPLNAMIPVSIRTGEETERWSNRVSGIFAELPTDEPDPVKRVQRVHDAMNNAKELFDALPADALTDFAQFPPPAVFARAMRLSTRLMTRNSPINLVISNVPGPRQPLYAAGSTLLHYYPVSTIVDGQGLNVTVQSYLDSLDFGLVSCRELVPDLWDMLDAILNDLAALGKATGVDVPL
ncbi:MAG: diacylglycerol O-acyltransferase / wax synthase [Acidimicrobiaceae bacterium]|jgi:WS/DGAT/MGAT family acyltransferase